MPTHAWSYRCLVLCSTHAHRLMTGWPFEHFHKATEWLTGQNSQPTYVCP
jgi:hypothetical protein